jgi:hypothetical protein
LFILPDLRSRGFRHKINTPASERIACRTRDYGYSTLSPQSTYILMPSTSPGPVELNHPESSESCKTFLSTTYIRWVTTIPRAAWFGQEIRS